MKLSMHRTWVSGAAVFVLACTPGPAAPTGVCASSSSTPRASSTSPIADIAAPPSMYDKPPQNVLDAMLAPSPPVPTPNANGDTLIMTSWVDYPPMSRVAEPFLKLAGVRLEPRTRARPDTQGGYGIQPCVGYK